MEPEDSAGVCKRAFLPAIEYPLSKETRSVKTPAIRWIARLLWVFPVLLLALTIYQADVAADLRHTLRDGLPAVAEVTGFYSTNRVDISYDYISLKVEMPDGSVLAHEKMALPHSFVPLVEGKTQLEVIVLPGADQEIVIEPIGRAHWRIAAINAAMCLVALVLSGMGVFAWNRYLARQGDPALRIVPAGEPAG